MCIIQNRVLTPSKRMKRNQNVKRRGRKKKFYMYIYVEILHPYIDFILCMAMSAKQLWYPECIVSCVSFVIFKLKYVCVCVGLHCSKSTNIWSLEVDVYERREEKKKRKERKNTERRSRHNFHIGFMHV